MKQDILFVQYLLWKKAGKAVVDCGRENEMGRKYRILWKIETITKHMKLLQVTMYFKVAQKLDLLFMNMMNFTNVSIQANKQAAYKI